MLELMSHIMHLLLSMYQDKRSLLSLPPCPSGLPKDQVSLAMACAMHFLSHTLMTDARQAICGVRMSY